MAKQNQIKYYSDDRSSRMVWIRHPNGNITSLKHRIVRHSPDGFNWGYGGSGPADLALNMLYDYLGRIKVSNRREIADRLYQGFKKAYISQAKDRLCITGEQIEAFLAAAGIRIVDGHAIQPI